MIQGRYCEEKLDVSHPNKNRTIAKQECDLLITIMIKDRIGRHEVLLPINEDYEKIQERNWTSVIRFHLKKNQLTQRNERQQRALVTLTVHVHRHGVSVVPIHYLIITAIILTTIITMVIVKIQ